MCNTESEKKNKIRIVPWMLNSYVVNMNTLPSSLPLLFYSLYNNYKILSKRITFEQIATSKIIAVFNHGTPRGSQHTQNVWGLFYLSTKKKVGVGGLCCFKNMHVSQSRGPQFPTYLQRYWLFKWALIKGQTCLGNTLWFPRRKSCFNSCNRRRFFFMFSSVDCEEVSAERRVQCCRIVVTSGFFSSPWHVFVDSTMNFAVKQGSL